MDNEDIESLVKRLERGGIITALEKKRLAKYIRSLENSLKELYDLEETFYWTILKEMEEDVGQP